MRILGIVSETHDSGLALLSDGSPEFVLEEERFNREKHTQAFPALALERALSRLQFGIEDVDVITIPWDVGRLRKTFFGAVFRHFPFSLNLLRPSAHATQDSGVVLLNFWLGMDLKRQLGVAKLPPIVNVAHHDAHAAIYFVSPFEEAAVLVMDGYGDDSSTSVYTGRDQTLQRQWHNSFFDSFGMLYTLVTMFLGFKPFEEGTVMALAACGDDTYVERFRDLIHLRDDGTYTINMDYFSYDQYGLNSPFRHKFFDVFGPARQPDEPITDRHKDLAFGFQASIEAAILHVVRHLARQHASRNLCLTGGVALNCVANSRILEESDFDRVWIAPCASDTGAPLGGTLWHYHQTLGHPRCFELTHPFFGADYTDAEIAAALEAEGLAYQHLSETELIGTVAQDLADGQIVGWFQGRFEMGPRALGNRSILADPRRAEMVETINARIKHREPFRPFAPTILVEHVADYFEIDQPDAFMTLAPKVRSDKAHLIPAAVHFDGTSRIQTVDKASNPKYYGVIRAFHELTGVPVVINTSFNRQEPIVASPQDAISCYLRTDMDAIALGNFYVRDRTSEAEERAQNAFNALVSSFVT